MLGAAGGTTKLPRVRGKLVHGDALDAPAKAETCQRPKRGTFAMRKLSRLCVLALLAAPSGAWSQNAPGPYHIVKTVKAGGEGGFDYVYADVDGRRLYIARRGDRHV